jgi:hypothetical protein
MAAEQEPEAAEAPQVAEEAAAPVEVDEAASVPADDVSDDASNAIDGAVSDDASNAIDGADTVAPAGGDTEVNTSPGVTNSDAEPEATTGATSSDAEPEATVPLVANDQPAAEVPDDVPTPAQVDDGFEPYNHVKVQRSYSAMCPSVLITWLNCVPSPHHPHCSSRRVKLD